MNHLIRRPRPVVVVLSVLCVVLAGATVAGAAPNTPDPAGPVMTVASAQGDAPNTIVVNGGMFTPGGRVYVALYDRPGAGPDETRSNADTPVVYGKNGSVDPAAKPGGGGAFDAAVGDWVTADPTIYGRSNSADPAAGFFPGGAIRIAFLIPCGATVTVRAFDRGTDSWSNPVDAHPGC